MTYAEKIDYVRSNSSMKVKELAENLSMRSNDIYYIRHLIKTQKNGKELIAVDEYFNCCPITGFLNY